MNIKKSGLENSSGSQEKWYVFDDHNLAVTEFWLPKIWSEDFARFLTTSGTVAERCQVMGCMHDGVYSLCAEHAKSPTTDASR